MSNARPIPEGMTGVIPHLTVKDAARAIDFYKRAFGATELSRHGMPDGSIMHASLRIGEGTVFLNDEFKEMGSLSPQSLGGSPVFLMLYVPDVDATVQRAVDAGAEVKMPVADQFWGDRYGLIADPFGHVWEIATHKEDLSKEEMERRGREAMAQMAQK
jgi:PhnB protein